MKRLIVLGSSALMALAGCEQTQNLGQENPPPPATDAGAGNPGTDAGILPPSNDAGITADGSPMHVDANVPSDAGTGNDSAPSNCPVAEGSQGVVLASGQPFQMRGLAVDANNVYWTTLIPQPMGIVATVPKSGGTVTTLATNQAGAFDVLSDGTSVYWSSLGASTGTGIVTKVPVGGGSPTVFWSPAFGTSGVFDLATDGTNLYWPGLSNMVVEPLAGGTLIAFNSVPPSTYVAVYGPTLYFSGGGIPNLPAIQSIPTSAAGAPLGDPNPQSLGTVSSPIGIVADASGVYWADQGLAPYSAGIITALPAGSSTLNVLVSGISFLEAIASDGAFVYWADGQGISKVPTGGGPSTVVAANEPGSANVKVDDSYVYWVNNCYGTVKKIAK